MLTQEELDKLLEKGGENPNSEAKEEQKASSDDSSSGPLSQEDLDKLLEEGGGQSTDEKSAKEQKTEDNVDWSDAFKEAADGGDTAAAKAIKEKSTGPQSSASETHVAEADFSELKPESSPSEGSRPELDFLLEIPLDISVEIGRSSMKIKELLQLGQGSIVELNKMAGEPADIYVNKKLMAKGEVVVVNEKFGIKLVEIISPAERVKSLG